MNVKIDQKTKSEATKLANKLGLSLSSVINASLKQFVRQRELRVSESYIPGPYLEKILEENEANFKKRKMPKHSFTSVDEMFKSLDE